MLVVSPFNLTSLFLLVIAVDVDDVDVIDGDDSNNEEESNSNNERKLVATASAINLVMVDNGHGFIMKTSLSS
jgi:hypothetical protein